MKPGFVGHMAVVTAIQFGCCSINAAIESMSMNGCGCVPIKKKKKHTGSGHIWPMKHSFPAPGLRSPVPHIPRVPYNEVQSHDSSAIMTQVVVTAGGGREAWDSF